MIQRRDQSNNLVTHLNKQPYQFHVAVPERVLKFGLPLRQRSVSVPRVSDLRKRRNVSAVRNGILQCGKEQSFSSHPCNKSHEILPPTFITGQASLVELLASLSLFTSFTRSM